MTQQGPSKEDRLILRAALGAFLAQGFHAIKLSELEAATGETWDTLTQRFGDKEALFLAAAEQGLNDDTVAALGKQDEVLEMLRRLDRVNGNPRLRAIHRPSLNKMRRIAEEQGSTEPRRSGQNRQGKTEGGNRGG